MATVTPMADFPWLSRLLQVSDSSFPTGGYAHSYGFEQAVQWGTVHNEESMVEHLHQHIWPTLIHFELPVVRLAHAASQQESMEELIELCQLVDAMKTAREVREASRSTGRRRLDALCKTDRSPVLHAFAQAIEGGQTHPHHPVVFGLGCRTAPLEAAVTAWAFQSLNGTCLSAPKLLRMGQDAAQRILTRSLTAMQERIAESLTIEKEQLGWFDPFLELASIHHETAYERLFIS